MPLSHVEHAGTNSQDSKLNRPYFSAVSRGEFSTVLNDTNFSIQSVCHPNTTRKGKEERRKPSKHPDGVGIPSSSKQAKAPPKVPLISENDFVALSLLALQGISSFIYKSDTLQQKQLHICHFVLLGRSATSLSKYQLAFSETFYIRLLLGSAHEAYLNLSSDRDLLLLHDASMSMLQEKLHNEERTSPSSLWSATTLHRSILCQLFRIIAPAELCDAFQQVFSTPLHSPKQNTDEKMNQFALLDLLVSRYMKPYTWMSGYRNNIGWAVLDSLLVHLEKARKMTSNTSNLSVSSYRPEVSRSLVSNFRMHHQTSLTTGEEEVLSDSLAKVVVILFLVKRVSIPLLAQLQRRLFCLEPDFETSAPVLEAPAVGRAVHVDLDKLDVYHMSVQKRNAMDGADVLVYSTVEIGPSGKVSTSPSRYRYRSPVGSPSGSPVRGRAGSSARQAAFQTPPRRGSMDSTDGNEPPLAEGAEGAVLKGSVVPSLLLALERSINPIRLICHAGEASHSSELELELEQCRGSNDLTIYGTKHVRKAAVQKCSTNMEFIDASSPMRMTDEEKCAQDSAVLSACRDSDAALLVPLNAADLQGLDLLVASAMRRFAAVRRAVLAEIGSWVSPEPFIIDHKALQLAMKRKFRSKFRGGHRDLLDQSEEGGRSDDEPTTPRSDAGSVDSSSDAKIGAGAGVLGSLGDGSDPDAAAAVTAALSAMELNRGDSTDASAADTAAASGADADAGADITLVEATDVDIPSESVDTKSVTDPSETVIQGVSGIEGRHPSCADDVIGATDLALSIPDPSPSGDVGAVSGAGVESESKVAQDIALCAIEHQEGDHVENQGADRKDVSRSPTSTTYTLASTHTAPASAPVPVPSSSSKRTDMSSLGLQMINPDLSFIDQEMRFREEITCTYSSGLLSLAKANGIVFKPPSTASSSSGREGSTPEEHFKEEEGALMLLMQPMQALLDGTLLSAVSWQCRVLDQAALFASICSDGLSHRRSMEGHGRYLNPFTDVVEDDREVGRRTGRERKNMGGLMWHIDCYEEAFLLSARSDVISSLVAILIETYAQRHPFSHSQSVFSTQRSRYLTNIRRKTAQNMLNEGKVDSGASGDARRRSTMASVTASGRSSSSSSVYGVEPMASMLDLWTEYSLKAALVKLKNQRPEASRSLTHVQYSITPIRERSLITDPELSPRASVAASSSSLSPASDSIFSGFGLDRLSICYTAAWPINTMITPGLLRVTARATRRLLELAQLTALVRFVWVDTRGRKNSSAVAERQHGAKRAIRGGPLPSSASSSSSYAAFDRDCSHALRIVQQTLLPLSDFTTDRIKSHQLKFRADILDASNHGFLGVSCALMRYAEGVAFSVFADEDGACGPDGADTAQTSDKESFLERARARATSELDGVDEDSSIADLISKVLEACRHVLIMLEMSSIQRSEEEASRGDSSVSLLFESASAALAGPESKKRTQMMARIKDSVRVLLQCRINLFSAAKRVAEEEDQQDALALLMFFNQ